MSNFPADDKVTDLHAAILNMPAARTTLDKMEGSPKGFYLLGFDHARHAAAELASAHLAAHPAGAGGDVFWLYELTKGEGIYQGMFGPNAESIVKQCAEGFDEAGEPFCIAVSPAPEGAEAKGADPRMAFCQACFVEVTPEQADQQTLDARRYGWLRSQCVKHGGLTIAKSTTWDLEAWSGDDPDRAIDSAMAKEQG